MSIARNLINEINDEAQGALDDLDSLSSIKVFDKLKTRIETKPAAQQATLYSGLVALLSDYIIVKTPSGELKFKGLIKEYVKNYF